MAHLWILLASIGVNYIIGTYIVRFKARDRRRSFLWLGVLFNVGLLLYYKSKVLGFGGGIEERATGFHFEENILIPLAISFFTFQQISYLVDLYKGIVQPGSLRIYILYIVFFPQLIMGPIVPYRTLAPQLMQVTLVRLNLENIAIGFSIFIIGLFKKLVLADSIAPFVNTTFTAASQGVEIGMLDAWAAIIAVQFQVYFDFSGYADMAVGLGRLFNLHLPMNFDAPLKAIDRLDYWRRWHISLSAFMRRYVFMPMVRHFKISSQVALAITVLLSGLWHGFGWTFLIWSFMQIPLMLASHVRRQRWRRQHNTALTSYTYRRGRRFAIAGAFIVSCLLGAIFRAEDWASLGVIYTALIGGYGLGLPFSAAGTVLEKFPNLMTLNPLLSWHDLWYLLFMAWIIWFTPPIHHLFRNCWKAPDLRSAAYNVDKKHAPPLPWFQFSLNRRWAVFLAALFFLCLTYLEKGGRFVYYQF
ncbi:MBOAT family O-acyltransferase [Magnetococcales bacterium HHB-1]